MTIPVTLNTISNLQDTTTAQTNINANSAAITGGFSTALNVTGDQMKGNLDMNSNQILNLPSPATAQSPVRLMDVTGSSSIASVPPVGTSGAVVGLLNANKTDSGNNTFTGTNGFAAVTATTLTATTVNASTLNVTSSAVFSGSVSLPLSVVRSKGAAINIYVNASTGSDSNTGGSPTTAFSTISAAVTYFQNNFDVTGVNINIAAGTYNEQVQIENLNRGLAMDIVLTGAGSASTIIKAPLNLNCLFLKDYGVADIIGLTLTGSSGAVAAISCGQFAICDVGSDVVLGSNFVEAHVVVSQNASVNFINNYAVSGSAPFHIVVSSGGIVAAGVVASISTALSFSTAYIYSYQGGAVNLAGYSVTGAGVASTTGVKFFRDGSAEISSGGLDLNAILPGNASGVYFLSSGFDTSTTANTVTSLNNVTAAKGYIAVVSDATATAANATVTGGGANTVLTWYNGSSWRILGS